VNNLLHGKTLMKGYFIVSQRGLGISKNKYIKKDKSYE